jgi:hypothetical protein
MTGLDLAGIDRELARFRGAADAVIANLLELDADSNRQLLDTAPLTGVTGAAWADARGAFASVWDWFARFTGFLDQAAALRVSPRTRLAPGRERQLATFLTDASIELARDDVPMRDRDLLQPRQATDHCTADELLGLMTDAFARARDVVVRVGTAWDELVPRVAGARTRALGLPASDELRAVQHRLDALADALLADPLAVDVHDVESVEADVDVLTRTQGERDQLRRDVLARVGDTRSRLDRLAEQAAGARCAWDTARAKVAKPEVPAPPVVEPALASTVDRIADQADAGRWLEADRELAALAAVLDALTASIDASLQECRDALAHREHLRGRLDAYRAKAHSLGLDEDDEVTATYERALAALHVAPADLVEASALLTTYQRLLTPTAGPEAQR